MGDTDISEVPAFRVYSRDSRLSLGVSQDKTVLVNLGRLGTEKNIGELLELFSRAVEKND